MTTKPIRRNINALESIFGANRNRASHENKNRVRTIIDLYTDCKISQVSTAINAITQLLMATTPSDKTKTIKQYDRLIEKHEEKQPLAQRMERSKKENTERRIRNTKKTYSIEVLFYTYGKDTESKTKPAFKDNSGRYLYLLNKEELRANIKATKAIEDEVKKRIIRDDNRDLFYKMIDILSQDDDIAEYRNTFMGYGLDALKILSATVVDSKGEEYSPRKRNLRNADNVGVYHRYVETELDIDYCTFEEAIKVKHYVKNECWINTLTDFYKDSLMGDKRKKQMTRNSVLELIGKTEEEFTTAGASIDDMQKVFREYRISARIFDYFENLIFHMTQKQETTT